MTKETKLGLAAIGVLLASFAGVLYMRLSGSGDPISPVAVGSADSKSDAAKKKETDVRSNLGTSRALAGARPAASGPFAARGSGRSDPFGSSRTPEPADNAETDSETEAPDTERYAHSYRSNDESTEEASTDEELADEEVAAEEFDQEIPDADDDFSEGQPATSEVETAWDEQRARDRYRSRLTDADHDWDADAAEPTGDGSAAEFDSEVVAATEPADEEFDPTGEVEGEPALIEEQESLQPLVADAEDIEEADSADTSSSWRMRESGASRAAFESDRPSRRPISSRPSSIAVEDEQPEEAVDGNEEFAEDDPTDVLTPEPMSLDEDRYAPPPRSNLIPIDGDSDSANTAISDEVSSDGTYVVQEGESLFDIAQRQLGSAARWAEIYDLNRDALGMELEHPPAGLRLALPESTAPPPARRALRPTSRRR